MSSSPRRELPALPSNFERNVLLLDAAEARQLARAAAMRSVGATVQCATSAEAARKAWKPGAYQLVLIEFQGGGPEFRQFYDYARNLSATQAFGFYVEGPPYLAASPQPQAGRSGRRESRPAANPAAQSTSLAAATEQIAAKRALDRTRREASPSVPGSFAAAVRAAEQAAAEHAAAAAVIPISTSEESS